MKFFMLPLLFAANYHMQNDNEIYEHGPEIIYNVTYNLLYTPPNNEFSPSISVFPESVTYQMKSQMNCQYDNPELLHCRLTNSNVNLTAYFGDSTRDYSKIFDDTKLRERYGSILFDIKLYKYGLYDILVPYQMNDRNYDELRVILYSLHTGVDPSREPGKYDAYDIFLTGNCLTHYDVTGQDAQEIDSDNKQDVSLNGKTIIIDKKRVEGKCGDRAYGVYATRTMKKRLKVDIKSSENYMKATDFTFKASTKFDGEAHLNDFTPTHTPGVELKGETKIVYDSVGPAKKKFKAIENPKSLGLVIGGVLNN